MKWSQALFPKILGMGFLVSGFAGTSEYEEAFEAAKKAALIQTGVTKKIAQLKKQATSEVKETLKKYEMLEEAATIGGILQIVKERGLKIKYEGVDYYFTPTQLKLTIYL